MLPTAFVAGPVKGGTSSIYECLSAAFHPKRMCGVSTSDWADEACRDQRFVLGSVTYASWQGPCFYSTKESPFGVWGRGQQGSAWQVHAGPAVPLRAWSGGRAACGKTPLLFAEEVEDMCLADLPCSRVTRSDCSTDRSVPLACSSMCDPCHLHPGTDVYNPITAGSQHVACHAPPSPCASAVCLPTHPSAALRAVNYSATHSLHFSVSAFPHRRVFAEANISAHRVVVLEGSPAVLAGGGAGGMATQLGSLTRPGGPYQPVGGRAVLRFIVGLREPVSLGLSYWMWMAPLQRLNPDPASFFSRGLDQFQSCERAVGAVGQVHRILHLNETASRRYYACMKRLTNIHTEADTLIGGLYALHLHAYFKEGFRGSQFLLVPTAALKDKVTLVNSTARFLGLALPVTALPRACGSQRASSRAPSTVKLSNNQSLAQAIDAFQQSATGERAREHFRPHNAALAHLIRSQAINIAGAVPSWLLDQA